MAWSDDAWLVINRVDKELPADATLKERKAALKEVAWHYHGGTSWGRKIWGRECRKYYERHGQEPRNPVPLLKFADDIAFPFRSQPIGDQTL